MIEAACGEYDDTGKLVMDDIYNRPDPIAYFSFLRSLDYAIPQQAKPVFLNIIEGFCAAKGKDEVTLIDLGCSYGINAALLKCGFELDDLYRLYDARAVSGFDENALIERDRQLFSAPQNSPQLNVIGIDVADQALDYAKKIALVDDTIAADFETVTPTRQQQAVMKNADLLISTGCIGYVTEQSLTRILGSISTEAKPWLAHFVLRMFPYDPIQEHLTDLGYVTATGETTFLQRRFASQEEQEHVCERLIGMGIDPSGRESEGWLHANFYLSRPVEDVALAPATGLIAPDAAMPA